MKRNPDLERAILIAMEANDGTRTPDLSQVDADETEIHYHITLLNEAGLIVAVDVKSLDNQFAMIPIRLTIRGHEYLEDIRDVEIWRRTKAGANAVSNFSLATLKALAKGFTKEKIRQHTGVEIDM
ncbi:MAG: DUF2513 domain-containing protein [Paracoccaceae bacterium]